MKTKITNIEKRLFLKNNYVIDNRIKYPIRLTTHIFDSPKFGKISYNIGSIITELGIIGIYQENNYTKLDLVINEMIYIIEFSEILSKDELNESIKYFINIIN
jgi:hypothetical protein